MHLVFNLYEVLVGVLNQYSNSLCSSSWQLPLHEADTPSEPADDSQSFLPQSPKDVVLNIYEIYFNYHPLVLPYFMVVYCV